jgi:hypothetical protein
MSQGSLVNENLQSLYDSLVDAGFHIGVDTSWKEGIFKEHY